MFEQTADKRHCRKTGEGVGVVNSSSSQSASKWFEAGMGCLPKNWQAMSVDEIKAPGKKAIISGPFGSNISSKYFVNDGVPVIRGNNLSLSVGRKFVDDGFVFITAEKAKELNTWATKGDLIFTAVGTIGQVGILTGKEKFDNYIISNKQLRLTVDTTVVDPLFSYYWFASDLIVEQIMQRNTGSSVPLINLSVLKSLIVPVPPPPEQRAIASVLSNLDDKIDLLNRQNKTLESMAETLFRQWFIEAPPQPSPRPSPSGRGGKKPGVVADLIEFNPQRALRKGTVAPYLEMASLSNTTFAPESWYEREFSSGTKFTNGDTLLARITPCLENGKAAYITFLKDEQVAWGSTEYIVMRPKAGLHPFFAYTLARNSDFKDYAEGCLEGSSGRQRVNVDHLRNYSMSMPDQATVDKFNAIANSIVSKLHLNSCQVRSLTKLRDTLLPKLMSGEAKVEI